VEFRIVAVVKIVTPRWALPIGDRALVAGPAGEVIGEALGVSTAAEMPRMEGAPSPEDARAILREWHIDLLLLIGHGHDGHDLCFFALRRPEGGATCGGRIFKSES